MFILSESFTGGIPNLEYVYSVITLARPLDVIPIALYVRFANNAGVFNFMVLLVACEGLKLCLSIDFLWSENEYIAGLL